MKKMGSVVFAVLLLVPVVMSTRMVEQAHTASSGHLFLTFDDAVDVDWQTAVPIMQGYGYRGIGFFAYLSAWVFNRLSKYVAAGWEIGSHTYSHPDLNNVSSSQLYREVVQSKLDIEAGVPNVNRVKCFAYPYSLGWDNSTVSSVVRATYEKSRPLGENTSIEGTVDVGVDRWCIENAKKGIDFVLAGHDAWFMFHAISDTPTNYITISTSRFKQILDLVKASGIQPVTWMDLTARMNGSIVIDEGAAYTTSEEVTLSLTYARTVSDVSQVRYSNDGVWDTEVWETPASTKSWTLSPGDGEKTVYYQLRDKAGLISSTYSDTITLDTSGPTGSIVIDSDATYATSTAVTLTLTYSDAGGSGVDKVRGSNDGSAWTDWRTASETNSWTLTSDDGSKTVYCQIRDNAGNIATYSDTIILDTTAPSGFISVNSGVTYTSSTCVALTLSATDPNGVADMVFSTDGTTWGAWEAYSTSKSWTLTGTDGTKTVYAKFMDNAGLESSIYEDSIILDTVAPVTNDDYDNLWHTTDFTVILTASDVTSGVSDIYYKVNGGATKTVSVDGQPQITTESATNSLEYWSVDSADNEETHHTPTTIKLDKTIPVGSIIINNGDLYTNYTSVTLNLTANDGGSGIYRVRLSNDGVWDTEQWETLSPTKSWNLTSGDGSKTVYFLVKDYAGLSGTYEGAALLDMTEPSIGTPSRVPGSGVQPNQSVAISVNVTDSGSGVKSVRLVYFTNASASGLESLMTFNQTSGLYESTIGGQGRGTHVKYEIAAFDNAGNNRTEDNAGEYYAYVVNPLYDLDGDGKIDMKDIGIIARAYGSRPGSANWNPSADINGDGKVDIRDICVVAWQYGQHYP